MAVDSASDFALRCVSLFLGLGRGVIVQRSRADVSLYFSSVTLTSK